MEYIEKLFVFNEDDDEWADVEEDVDTELPEEDSDVGEEDTEDEEESFEEV